MVITPEIKSGDLEFDSQPRPRIFHLLQWVSISVPEDLYIYIYIIIISIKLKRNDATNSQPIFLMMHSSSLVKVLYNLSTVEGYHDTCGGYRQCHGVFSTVGYSNDKRFTPTVLNNPRGTVDINMRSPRYWAPPTVMKTHYTGWLHPFKTDASERHCLASEVMVFNPR